MGVQAATQGKNGTDVLPLFIAPIEFLRVRIPTDFGGTEHREH